MFVVGLTGGIAAGKSFVARRFAERGAAIVDADRLAREVVEPGTAGLAQIVERFGEAVIHADGRLDRTALGGIVFADPQARHDLEAIIHPAVQALSRERMREAVVDAPARVVVYDIPLLVETKAAREFDRIVVVDAPRELRIRRLVELRGLAEAEAAGRVDAQASDAERRAIADHIIDSSGSIETTVARADAVFATLADLAGEKARSGASGDPR